MRHWLWWLSLVAVLAAPDRVGAQQVPPEGCFCLADAYGQLQRGCERKKFHGQFYWSAICRYALPDGTVVTPPATRIIEAWTVVSPGDPGCTPCDPQARPTEDVPRGDSEKDEEQ